MYYSTGYELDGDTYYTIPRKYQLSDTSIIKDSIYCDVTFKYNNGSENTKETIRSGTKLARPDNPIKEEKEFAGWYYTPNGGEETEFDFDSEVTQDYELNAKWVGLAVMKPRGNNNPDFWEYSSQITSIVFKKGKISVPTTAIKSWDVKADGDYSEVRAYTEDDGTENGTYKLTIVSSYTIYANPYAANYFNGFSNLTSITFDNFDTSKVTNLGAMFCYCGQLTNLNLSSFNTDNVTIMQNMFKDCVLLKSLSVSSFNTSKVTDMANMFQGCIGLTNLDVSGFDTSNVTNMSLMFCECRGLTSLDLSSFNTSNVTNINEIFRYCSNGSAQVGQQPMPQLQICSQVAKPTK